SVGQAARGAVTMSDDGTSVTYAPSPGYSGPDSFTYTATNGISFGTATVHLNASVPTQPIVPQIKIVADTDRNGQINSNDETGKSSWAGGANGHGAIVMLNSDRDCTMPQDPSYTCDAPDNFAGGDWDLDGTDEKPNAFVDD